MTAMNRLTIPGCFLLALGCGGGQDQVNDPAAGGGEGLGDSTATAGTEPGLDPAAGGDAGVGEPEEAEPPAVTFEILNSWTEDLVFNLDAGWGGTILIYSGVPPKAKSVLPWPTHCTAGCDVDEAERCPVCKKPEKITEIREAETREIVEPGKTFELGWEGEVHVYEKTRVGKKRCQCFTKAPVPEETYTVRACGLRLSQVHKKQSTFQCVVLENALTFPAEEPQRVVLDFGDPKPKKKKKKGR
jgi:hypothetical protein